MVAVLTKETSAGSTASDWAMTAVAVRRVTGSGSSAPEPAFRTMTILRAAGRHDRRNAVCSPEYSECSVPMLPPAFNALSEVASVLPSMKSGEQWHICLAVAAVRIPTAPVSIKRTLAEPNEVDHPTGPSSGKAETNC